MNSNPMNQEPMSIDNQPLMIPQAQNDPAATSSNEYSPGENDYDCEVVIWTSEGA